MYGFTLPSINIIPSLDDSKLGEWSPGDDTEPVAKVRKLDEKLKRVKANLVELYNAEFIPQLISQATDKKDRYAPVSHNHIKVGEIVLIKEEHTKQANYPMGRVKKVTINSLGEVTSADIYKGKTGETVNRTAGMIIPLLQDTVPHEQQGKDGSSEATAGENRSTVKETKVPKRRLQRAAAKRSAQRTRAVLQD